MVVGCRPDIDDDASRIDRARVLAVRSDPPEAKPNEKVSLTALYTDGSRVVTNAPLGWSFCNARRALAEPGPIDPGCLAGTTATRIGGGGAVPATLSRDACRAFGPDRPFAKPGEPAGRPADPDPTGGFFQPGIVVGAGIDPAKFEVRVRCSLPSVPPEVSLAFEQRYRTNTNPEIAAVVRIGPNGDAPIGDELRASPGESIRLRVSWPHCTSAAPCGGAEPYVSFDPASRKLVDRREALVVSWLTTAGTFVAPRTGRDEPDFETSTDDTFVAPNEAATGTIFVVLRDARGGVGFRAITLRVD